MICLDLDGTLEDSRRDMISVVHRLREALGLPRRTDDAILPWVNKGMEQLYRACFDDYLQADEGAPGRSPPSIRGRLSRECGL
ncbi:MAG: hypothetical protein MPW14_03405 [Candidatus Manganitrophus sp.]|nr:MAG: hypothetical protein MPW14_03405 [Candidatus Manganitrophus sp.]